MKEEDMEKVMEKAMGKKINNIYSWKNCVLKPLRRFF
jgi:hypothetical protein